VHYLRDEEDKKRMLGKSLQRVYVMLCFHCGSRRRRFSILNRSHNFQNTKPLQLNQQLLQTYQKMNIVPTSLPVVCDESVMSQKKHGSSETPVQSSLRWGCDVETADRICNFNRHYAGEF
jgi:hypothetical protein